MARKFYGSINVSKINKDKLFNGKKGIYANVIVWLNDTPNEYGNILSIQESLSKEERDTGVKANYLGSLKESDTSTAKVAALEEKKEDLPF